MKPRWSKDELALPLFLALVVALAIPLAFLIRTWMETVTVR